VSSDKIYVDPSALARLFIHQEGSKEMSDWRRRLNGPLSVTHHGRTEIINAIGLAAFRGMTTVEDANAAWQELEQEFIDGNFKQADLLWRAALNRAGNLSWKYSAKLGTRSLDVLHVSCALELQMTHLLSFDERQNQLAEAVGIKGIVF
jgi:predicted nucleic acid-binding protein